MPRSASTRSTRTRRAVTYKEPKDDGESSSSEEEEEEEEEPAIDRDEERNETDDDDAGEEAGSQGGQSRATQAGSPNVSRSKKPRVSVAAGTRKSRAKKPPSLSKLVELPLDVLATIFSTGDLQSLYYLSRLNKKFRSFLLSRSVTSVWHSCMKNSELPDSLDLDSFNILAWSNLLFGECQICGGRTTNVDPYLRIKACGKSCYNTLTIHASKISPEQQALSRWVALVYPKHGRNVRQIYLLADFEDAEQGIKAAEEATAQGDDSGTFQHRRYGPIPLKDFKGNLSNLVNKQFAEGDLMEAWLKSEKSKQASSHSQVRKQRIEEIKKRFVDLGFEDQHFNGEFLQHKTVRSARPLTENTWPSVHSAVLPILERSREAAIAAALAPMREARLKQLELQWEELWKNPDATKKAGLFPLQFFEVYFNLPTFQAFYFPPDAVITPTTFVDHGPEMAIELKLKLETLYDGFFAVLQGTIGIYEGVRKVDGVQTEPFLDKWLIGEEWTEEEQKEALKSCLALFTCTRCTCVSTYPQLFHHSCQKPGYPRHPTPTISSSYVVDRTTLQFAVAALQAAQLSDQSFEQASYSPLAIPQETVDAKGYGFSCIDCPPSFDTIGRDWLGIVEHMTSGQHSISCRSYGSSTSIVCEPPALAQLRLLKAHEDCQNDRRGIIVV